MVRRITFAVSLVVALLLPRQASAITLIPSTNLDGFPVGALHSPLIIDLFEPAAPPPLETGTLEDVVFFDGTFYHYVHRVEPSTENNFTFNTEFAVGGFTGVAGYSFSDTMAAGGDGTDMDFAVVESLGRLNWVPRLADGGALGGWEANEPITFFFQSTLPPTIKDYNLISTEAATAQSYAPVPEPGSIALFGSGLVGLYAAIRRRRNLKM